MTMNLFELTEICKNQLSVLQYLQDRKIIHSNVHCFPCNQDSNLIKDSSNLSGYFWRCIKCKCKQSVLKDSFIEGARISPAKFLYILFYWATETPLRTTIHHLDISPNTGVDYYSFVRDMCSWKLHQDPVQLGGQGQAVQIDQYRRGRNCHQCDQWVFGAYDVSEKVGYITYVGKRDAATLLPIIERVVAPGSVIVSDEWAAYRNIPNLPNKNYTHETVNHSQHFIDPVSGLHTNNVKCYWKRAKSVFTRMNGTTKDLIPTHLDEFMWRERYGQTFNLAFLNILDQIFQRYPC